MPGRPRLNIIPNATLYGVSDKTGELYAVEGRLTEKQFRVQRSYGRGYDVYNLQISPSGRKVYKGGVFTDPLYPSREEAVGALRLRIDILTRQIEGETARLRDLQGALKTEERR